MEEHLISESRYTSYLNMLEDKEEGKYRAAYKKKCEQRAYKTNADHTYSYNSTHKKTI